MVVKHLPEIIRALAQIEGKQKLQWICCLVGLIVLVAVLCGPATAWVLTH